MNHHKSLETRLQEMGNALDRPATLRNDIMQRIERLDADAVAQAGGPVRNWINQNSAVVTVLFVTLLSGSSAFIINRYSDDDRPLQSAAARAYYYDTTTGSIFTALATELAPMQSPDGHIAVRAHLYSCGGCEQSERFIGYFERYTDQMKAKLKADPSAILMYAMWIDGREYSIDGTVWHAAASAQGQHIAASVHARCPARSLRYCTP